MKEFGPRAPEYANCFRRRQKRETEFGDTHELHLPSENAYLAHRHTLRLSLFTCARACAIALSLQYYTIAHIALTPSPLSPSHFRSHYRHYRRSLTHFRTRHYRHYRTHYRRHYRTHYHRALVFILHTLHSSPSLVGTFSKIPLSQPQSIP